MDNQKENDAKSVGGKDNTYVIVSICDENYAIDVMDVNIINGLTEIRPIPNTQPYMKGVITLRETIVPVIDMRIKFNLETCENTKTAVIVIVSIYGKLIGMFVDSVLDVVSLSRMDVQDTPHFAANINSDYISGISEVQGKLVVILDIKKVITKEELENVAFDKAGI